MNHLLCHTGEPTTDNAGDHTITLEGQTFKITKV